MSVASRLPAFVLLGLVLLAAALLVAGYGVAVGVGVITGVVLGGATILAFIAMNPRSGPAVGFWTRGASHASPDEPAMALLERHGRDAMRVAGVDEGALRRVIPAGSAGEAGGVRVELVAVEIREDGGIAAIVAHTRPPIGTVGHFAEATLSDDTGTAYVAAGQGSGGSSPAASRHEIRFAPAPPANARVLIVRIERFADPFPGRVATIEGPWEFRVEL